MTFDLPLLLVATVLSAQVEPSVDYVRDIKPLLQERCFACHGGLKQNAKLRVDTVLLMKKGGRSGPAVVPGNADRSPLLVRVTAHDETERMPPEGPPLSPAQVAKLRRWIAEGATGPANEQPERDPLEHWAFRTPRRPAVPAADGAINPLDAFVLAELRKHGLRPRPEADPAILLRRIHLDLTGLPPTVDEQRAFLADPSTAAYERVVDRLLASPEYGERWARHWMDVWRYSDWYGRRMVPDVWNSAPQIWRWRAWIVRSLREDKGYDRMVQEMLAADEIAPEDADAAVATGYLIRNWYALNPNDWMRQNVEHTAKAFLGLTFNCAHCHDHKYDPISHEDYFRLRAFFEPISIRQDRVAGEGDPGPFQEYDYAKLRKVVRLGAVRIYDKNPSAPTWFYTGGDERYRVKEKGSLAPAVPAFLGRVDVKPVELPAGAYYPGSQRAIQEAVLAEKRAALVKAVADLTTLHLTKSDTRMVRAAEARVEACAADLASASARIAADQAKHDLKRGTDPTPLVRIAADTERRAAVKMAMAEVLDRESTLALAEAKPVKDATREKELAAATKQLATARAVLLTATKQAESSRASPSYTPLSPIYPATSTGRRRALARWITDRANPLAARVAVNHIWMRHFHAPLVASVFDFGRNGASPSHPELLDWLAVEFMESGWSMKHLHRLIVTSQAYRRTSSAGSDANDSRIDPENKYLWRMNAGRMEAEIVRDSLLACAGRLDRTMGGQELENSEALTTRRRSLYYSCYPENGGRSEFGALFDAPDAGECYRRTRTILPQQALALTNSDFVHRISVAIVDSLDASDSPQAFVAAAFARTLSRPPTAAEMDACVEFLREAQGSGARGRASLVRALLNHNDFITIR